MFIVFDLDDTLACTDHRQHILEQEFDTESEKWNAFFDQCYLDKPVPAMILLFMHLVQTLGIRVEIWTGRSDRVAKDTTDWLNKHTKVKNYSLRMRKEGDFRPDTEIKAEMIKQHGRPDIVFDDRNKMVAWWREQGITCCQVKESDF